MQALALIERLSEQKRRLLNKSLAIEAIVPKNDYIRIPGQRRGVLVNLGERHFSEHTGCAAWCGAVRFGFCEIWLNRLNKF